MSRNKLLRSPRLWNKISDFANVCKAFIGSNFLTMPFAFKQSGLVLGIIGLCVIALITDHCCLLIIKCKRAAIDQVISSALDAEGDGESEKEHQERLQRKRSSLELAMSYGDIGMLSVGKFGLYIVNAALVVTQFSACVNYFIFIGDTVARVFATHNETSLMSLLNSSSKQNSTHITYKMVSMAPNSVLLMLIPFPAFLLQTFVRNIRSLGPLSTIGNACVLFGCFSVLGFIFHEIDFGNIYKVDLWRFTTFPIFFGQVTYAYEGIGTIIPIEASMNENRPNYPNYLHGALFCVSVILGTCGIFGYLHYTEDVQQLISDNLPYGTLAITVHVTLCIAILFSYPLQMFPVVELAENFLFENKNERNTLLSSFNGEFSHSILNDGNIHYDGRDEVDDGGNSTEIDNEDEAEEKRKVEEDEESPCVAHSHPVVLKSRYHCDLSWSTWKRNILRSFLVALSFGVGYAFRDYYAYVSAVSGSIGSSLLAFILPCIFHLILKRDTLSCFIITKDVILILFGIVAGLSGFVTTLIKII